MTHFCFLFTQYSIFTGRRVPINCSVVIFLSQVWNTSTCEFVRTLNGHKRGIACLQYRDRLVVSGSSDNTIRWAAGALSQNGPHHPSSYHLYTDLMVFNCLFVVVCCCCLGFETVSLCSLAVPELASSSQSPPVLLPGCWDYRCGTPPPNFGLVWFWFFFNSIFIYLSLHSSQFPTYTPLLSSTSNQMFHLCSFLRV